MKMRRIVLTATLLIAASFMSGNAQAASFKIIVNNGLRVDSLPKKAVSDFFMKRAPKWENGTPVTAVDQEQAATVREQFSRAIHGKPAAAVKSYWNQQIFSGREVPPLEKRNDAEVVAFVRANAGAIGYVSDTAPTDGVRVVSVQ